MSRKKIPEAFKPGDKVWYRRPENSGGPVDSRWLGPAMVIVREGEYSYQVEVKPGHIMKAHRTFLKPHVEDKFSGEPLPLFYHRRMVFDDKMQPDEYVVDRILRHRTKKDGSVEFLTRWKGFPKEEATWEPPNHFIHRYSSDFVEYCSDKGIFLELVKFLQDKPHRE